MKSNGTKRNDNSILLAGQGFQRFTIEILDWEELTRCRCNGKRDRKRQAFKLITEASLITEIAKMSKTPKQPKPLKAPKIKLVSGYIKKNGQFVNPHLKGLPKF